jgi:hypothetical protein
LEFPLRTFLNAILSFIGSESLTDEEFDALPDGLTEEYTKAVYDALKAVIQTRDGVSGQLKKLQNFFTAKGVDLSGRAIRDPDSEIFIGAALEP